MSGEFAAALERVVAPFADRCERITDLRDEVAFKVERTALPDLVRAFKDDEGAGLNFLVLVTAVDNYLDEPRFEVVYVLRSMKYDVDVRLNAPVPGEDPSIGTVSGIFAAANWMEREVWDMFGVRFSGHPDPTRIMMWEGFEGHPLRKDYPLLGNTPGTPGYIGKGGKL